MDTEEKRRSRQPGAGSNSRNGAPQRRRPPERTASSEAFSRPSGNRPSAPGGTRSAPRGRENPHRDAGRTESRRPAARREEFRQMPESRAENRRPAGNRTDSVRSERSLPQSRHPQRRRQETRRRSDRSYPERAPQPAEGRQKRPEIIYTPPKPFNRNRFLLRLGTATAVVLALTFVLSVFFKVKVVTVSGANLYTPYQVMEASGIRKGNNLLSVGKTSAYAKIKTALPYVSKIRISIKLPDTVNIGIEERDVVYSVQAQDDAWWLISADGEVVGKTDSAEAEKHIQVSGIKLASPEQGQKAMVSESAADDSAKPEDQDGAGSAQKSEDQDGTESAQKPEDQEEAESAQKPDDQNAAEPAQEPEEGTSASGALRLKVALEILQSLEKYGLVQDVTSVDVHDVGAITVMYGNRFEVRLGNSAQLDYKVKCMKQAVGQMKDYQSGILDVSFTTWENMVGYTPFE